MDVVGAAVLGAILLVSRINSGARDSGRLFRTLAHLVLLIFLLDIPAWLLDGVLFHGARALCIALDTVYYLCQIAYCYLWLMFAFGWVGRTGLSAVKKRMLAIPALAEGAVILLNLKTGWIFSVDALNVYARGEYYIANLAPYYFYIAGAIVVALHAGASARTETERQAGLSLLAFMLLPVCGTILETFFYGVSWLWPFSALSLLMVWLYVQQRSLSEERVDNAKREQDSRVAIMMSQIQPHFLYNALTAISQLCDSDPKRAKKATVDFAAYLRTNLDSLGQQGPVAFEKELQHVRTYLELEQMRFGGELHVVYEIAASGFRLPPLTVQPLAENAVKHGVGEKEDGGTVTVSSYETQDSFVVTVRDDGVGFDADERQSDARTHIGIKNVRGRLAAQCKGTLDIKSKKGLGTTATITIPKEAVAP